MKLGRLEFVDDDTIDANELIEYMNQRFLEDSSEQEKFESEMFELMEREAGEEDERERLNEACIWAEIEDENKMGSDNELELWAAIEQENEIERIEDLEIWFEISH